MERLKELVKINCGASDLHCDGGQTPGLNIDEEQEQENKEDADPFLVLLGNNEQ